MKDDAHSEMTIPKSEGEAFWTGFYSLIVVGFAVLALFNLVSYDALGPERAVRLNAGALLETIPSLLWLLIVAWILWHACREAGGARRYLTDWLAAFSGRKFVCFAAEDTAQECIRFGYELFGRRFFQKDVEIDRIESVEWSSGQATSMAGRDMDDWRVLLWYDHGNFEKSKKNHMLKKPDQSAYIVGPPRRKGDAAVLGRGLVLFLGEIGVHLKQDTEDNVFRR